MVIQGFPGCCAYMIISDLPFQKMEPFPVNPLQHDAHKRYLDRSLNDIRVFLSGKGPSNNVDYYMIRKDLNIVATLNEYQVRQGVGKVLEEFNFKVLSQDYNPNTKLICYTYIRKSTKKSKEQIEEAVKNIEALAA